MIELVGFDGDDTLWHSEGYYQAAQQQFERVLARYVEVQDQRVHDHLLSVQKANLKIFGYGARSMMISMIEAAIAITEQRISAADVHQLVEIGKDVLQHPVELLPGIRAAVEAIAQTHPLVLITKGDLFHQEAKVRRSGLGDLFRRIEIVSEKDAGTYARLLAEFDIEAAKFVMVGNSLRSDIEPVIRLGGWGIHMPYHVTWAHELENALDGSEARLRNVTDASEIPSALKAICTTADVGVA
jgi:putative hydrolase of the HAD superfamily